MQVLQCLVDTPKKIVVRPRSAVDITDNVSDYSGQLEMGDQVARVGELKFLLGRRQAILGGQVHIDVNISNGDGMAQL
jgi:hypothetical protein